MKYKIRVFNTNTNMFESMINKVFESKEEAEMAIERLIASSSNEYQYIKVPIKE